MKININKKRYNINQNKHKVDNDGRVIVEMHVEDDSSFLSAYSENETPIISEEVAIFLENITHSIPYNNELTLKIHSNCIDEDEKITYKKAFENYYSNRLVYTKRELFRSTIIGWILSLLGIITLVLVQIFYMKDSVIWTEVIDIVAWVFLWEAVDVLVFKTRSLRLNKKKFSAFITMKIEYCDE